jgi:hypothetical protein
MIGNEEEYFAAIGTKIECEEAHFTSTLAAANAHLTVTPQYTDHTFGGDCRAGGTLVTTITVNGCTYTFKVTGTKEANINYNVGVDLVCPAGKTMVIHIRNLPDTADACTITIGAQSAVGDLIGKTNGDHINLSGTVEVKTTLHSHNTVLCGLTAGTSKDVVSQYVINQALTFTSTGKKISLSD